MALIYEPRTARATDVTSQLTSVLVARRRPVVRAAAGLLGTWLWAAFCCYLLNLSVFVGLGDLEHFRDHSIFAAALAVDGALAGTVWLWTLLMLVRGLTGRTLVACTVLLELCLLLGAANAAKLRVRHEPLALSDTSFVTNPDFLADMVPPLLLARLAGALVAIAVLALVVNRLVAEAPDARPTRTTRVVSVVLAGGLLATSGGFHGASNPWRMLFDADVRHWATWSQTDNFVLNGFVAGALYDLPMAPMPEPAGYTRARMLSIVETYTRAAARTNAQRAGGSLDDVNVVLVLSESFSDPTRLGGVTLAEDPIPATRAVLRQSTSGSLLVGQYGGGTSTVEFEVLTGMSGSALASQVTSPYQQLVVHRDTFPSLVPELVGDRHVAVAVHPYSGSMYRRREVYPRLGFDAFVEESDLRAGRGAPTRRYVEDESAFGEVLHHLGRHEDPVVAHLVTMQNHMPYDDPGADPGSVGGVDGDAATQLASYAAGLERSDEALRRFLGELRGLREKTVVVFYGDHLPGLYPAAIQELNGEQRMRETPFFVWKNFGPDPLERPTMTVSPGQLVPVLLETVDAPVSPYVALLDTVRAEVPAVQRGMFVRPDGSVVDREADLPDAARRALEDYRLVQYDLAVGQQWSAPGLVRSAPRPGGG